MFEEEIGEKKNMNINKILLFKGIILPFNNGNIYDMDNEMIVRIIPSKSACFSTKARVPVKTVCECVSVWECAEWDKLYIKENEEEDLKMSKLEDTTSRESINNDIKEENVNQMNNNVKSKEIEAENIKEINLLLKTVQEEEMESKTGKRKISKSMYVKRSITRDSFTNDTASEEFLLLVSQGQFNPFGEKWSETIESIKQNSPFKNFSTYSVKSFIAKANDDLRQEVMTMQLIEEFDKAFKKENTNLRLRPYEILITSSSSGLIEFLPNSISIDGLKKQLQSKGVYGLHQFFKIYFKNKFEEAQRNFVCSLAAYSLVCYFLSIKDRHNGNIMLDMNGYVVHIDYGFILGINNMNFENTPFKFTKEYFEIMEGENSDIMDFFINEFIKGLLQRGNILKNLKRLFYQCVQMKEVQCRALWEERQRILLDSLKRSFI